MLLCRSLDEDLVSEESLRALTARRRGDSLHTAYYTDQALSDTVECLSRARALL
jgi:hypothetical protein